MLGQVLGGHERHLAVFGAVGDQRRHPDRGQEWPDVHVVVAIVEAEHGLARHVEPSEQPAGCQIRHIRFREDPADVVAHQACEVVVGEECRCGAQIFDPLCRAVAGPDIGRRADQDQPAQQF
jgi:hypothetical protein